jgi:hypothetical protein
METSSLMTASTAIGLHLPRQLLGGWEIIVGDQDLRAERRGLDEVPHGDPPHRPRSTQHREGERASYWSGISLARVR